MGHFQNIIVRPVTAETTTSTTGTVYQDLPELGQLSCLMVDVANVCQYVDAPALDIWNTYTKFEVLVNGSKVIKSFDMKQARALAHYWGFDLNTLGYYERQDTSGDKTFWHVPILFGRYPGDKEYMLDMEQYSNPQLRITYDATQLTVEGGTYDVSATPCVRTGCHGLIWRGGNPGTKGYIKSTNIDTWGAVASTVRTVEIPRGQHLLGVMQGARHLDDKLIDYIERMEITFDNGDWQPINHSYNQLSALDAMWFPRPVKIGFRKDLVTNLDIDLCVGLCDQFTARYSNETGLPAKLNHEGNWNIQKTTVLTHAGAAFPMCSWDVSIQGRFPHQNMYIPFRQYSEDDAFGVDTTKWGRIDMKTTAGAAAAASELVKTVAEFAVPNGE